MTFFAKYRIFELTCVDHGNALQMTDFILWVIPKHLSFKSFVHSILYIFCLFVDSAPCMDGITLFDFYCHCFPALRGICACSFFQLYLTLWTPWTVGHQVSLSMEFSRQEYWSGLPFPPPCDRYAKIYHSVAVSTVQHKTQVQTHTQVFGNHHLQSFPASGSYLMSQLFPSGGQSIGGSASALVLPLSIPMNTGVEIGREKSIETESRLVVARGWKEEEVRVGNFCCS